MVKEVFLFIFVLHVLQEMSMPLPVPFCEVHCCGVFLHRFFLFTEFDSEILIL